MTRRLFIAVVLVTAFCGSYAADAPAQTSREYQIKAAFIYNFMQFVDWPQGTFADPKAPIIIATLGPDPFNGLLDVAMKGRTVGQRSLVVRHFSNAADATKCQVLFVAADGDDQFSATMQKLGPTGILTVGETEGFIQSGGIIRFYEKGTRLRFAINQNAASRAKLQIRAKLLRLAAEEN